MISKEIKPNKVSAIYQAKNGAIELRGDFTRDYMGNTSTNS
jgi:hypothetical protein